jgi:hypothetical protein
MNFVVLSGAALALTWITSDPEKKHDAEDGTLPNYKDYAYEIVTDFKGESQADDEEIEGKEYVNPSMEYKSICTEFVNKAFLSQKSNVFEYLRLVIDIFTDALHEYCQQHDIDSERIRFVYKGGNILRIVANEFVLELPGHASDIINEFYNPFFKRTDADFSIYIDPTLEKFDTIVLDLTTITWKLQQLIRDTIVAEPTKYLDFFRLNQEAQQNALTDLLTEMQSSKTKDDPSNKTFFGSKINGVTFRGTQSVSGYKPIELPSPDVFIALDEKKNTVTFSTDNIDRYLRIQVNTALDFGSGSNRSTFNLVRIKVIFPTSVTNSDGVIKTYNFGGELLDVSIPKREDRGLRKFFSTPNVISKYELKQQSQPPIVFYAYTLQSLINDLDYILFEFNEHPWDDNKYSKRLNRLFYLCFVDLFIRFGSNEDRKKYMKKWCETFAVTSGSTSGNAKRSQAPAFEQFGKRIKSVKQPETSTSYTEYKEFIEQIQKNCIVVLTALKNIGSFCSKSWTLPKRTIYQADLDALIHGEN